MPTKVKIDLTDLKKFNKNLQKKMPLWIEAALTDYGLILEELIVDEIDATKLNVSGEMKKSVTHIVKERLYGWLITVGTNVNTSSGYNYAVGVHEGTIPHWPPVEPIKEWARKKLNISDARDLAKATWFIRKKISKEGTKPHPFMQNVFIKEKSKIRKEIGRALLRAMKGGRVV